MITYDNFIKSLNSGLVSLVKKKYNLASKHILNAADTLIEFGDGKKGEELDRLNLLAKSLYDVEEQIDDLNYYHIHKDEKNPNECEVLSGIAGNKELKNEIMRLIINPMSNVELYSKFHKHRGGGILMYGVPGTGKSRIASEIAKEIDAEFYEIKCSSIISKWFGESERNINDIFEDARKHKCSIIFFDEFEALSMSRDFEHGAISRVVSELLAQIQGCKDSNNTLILLAATNRPWDIDSAFLRPGRFSTKLLIPLPDYEARLEITRQELDGVPQAIDFSYEEVALATNGFSNADVVEFVERIKDLALERSILKGDIDPIRASDINTVIELVKSSVVKKDLERIVSYSQNK